MQLEKRVRSLELNARLLTSNKNMLLHINRWEGQGWNALDHRSTQIMTADLETNNREEGESEMNKK